MKAELTWFRNNIDHGKGTIHEGTKHDGHYVGITIHTDKEVTAWGGNTFQMTVPCSQYSIATYQEMKKIVEKINS